MSRARVNSYPLGGVEMINSYQPTESKKDDLDGDAVCSNCYPGKRSKCIFKIQTEIIFRSAWGRDHLNRRTIRGGGGDIAQSDSQESVIAKLSKNAFSFTEELISWSSLPCWTLDSIVCVRVLPQNSRKVCCWSSTFEESLGTTKKDVMVMYDNFCTRNICPLASVVKE